MPRKWTTKDDKYLRRNYLIHDNTQLARFLRVSPDAVGARLRRLGLKRTKGKVKAKGLRPVVGPAELKPKHWEPAAAEFSPAGAVKAFERGIRLFQKQQYAEAKRAFQAILNDSPHALEIHARVRMYLEKCESHLGRPQRPVVEKGEDPTIPAVMMINSGRYDEAIRFLEQVHGSNRNPHCQYLLANALVLKGDLKGALDHLKRAIHGDPTYRAYAMHLDEFAPLRQTEGFRSLIREGE